MYVGFYSSVVSDERLNISTIFRNFALLSIIGMTLITVYVVTTYGNLVGLWSFAKSEGGSYTVFLHAYKNANPYKFAILLPFLFLKKNKYNLLFVVICIINILIAGKRGPLLGIIISTAFLYLYVWHKRLKIFTYCAYLVLILFLYIQFFDDNIFQTLIYRLDPTEHYNASADFSFYSSGRDQIWYTILDGFFDSNIYSQFMGHGTIGAYTYLIAHNAPQNAHNTWLEILFNFGIVGMFIFIYYYIVLIQICIKMKKSNYKWKSIAIFLVLFNLLSTFYTVTYRAGFAFAGYANMLFSYLFGNYLACESLYKGNKNISFVDIVRCYLLKSRKEKRNTISSNTL
jgi:O-antigen ligase